MSYVRLISLFIGLSMLQILIAGPLEVVAGTSLSDSNSDIAGQLSTANNDAYTDDQICGTHPLKTIVKKIETSQPNMDQEAVLRLLALMRLRAPKLWNSYQQMLAAYMNCKVMSAGGSLG
uniref:Rap1a domain-containing protein n=1 Tax=Panagrellus redivivus TaxID=6233 RepID=A0A7E4ZQX5_PANRE